MTSPASLSLPPTLATSSPSVTVGDSRVRLLRDGAAAFPAMLEAIAKARREILLEMYWIGADRVGHRFRDALIERARSGVRVCVLYDAVGSLGTPAAFWVPLTNAGADVREFSPISPFRSAFHLEGLTHRDHRKLLVVDAAVGFVGGINIGEEWLPEQPGRLAWRDDGVAVEGPVVADLRAAFYRVWRRLRGPVPVDVDFKRRAREGVRVLTNRIGRGANRSIAGTYRQGLRRAKASIDIASAYFLPGPRFLIALRRAARRGVRIRLLVPERSDLAFMALAMGSLYGRLMSDGVRVFAYVPRILHAKTAVFDGRFTMIGSHNLDSVSSRFNLECDVAIESEEFARTVVASFERDLAEARELDLGSWRNRPATTRLVGWFVALFERLL